jgi:hypothetical protein
MSFFQPVGRSKACKSAANDTYLHQGILTIDLKRGIKKAPETCTAIIMALWSYYIRKFLNFRT